MLFRNISNGQEINVSNVSMKDGRIFFSVRGKGCGKKFYNRNVCVMLDEEAKNGTFLKCAEGWEVVNTPKRAKKEKKAEHEAVNVEQTNNVPEPTHEEVVNVAPTITEEEKPQPKAPAKSAGKTATAKGIAKAEKNTEDDDARQLAAILARMKGGEVDENKVREIVREELANSENKNNNNQTIEIKIIGKEETAKVENPHPLLEKVLKLVANDRVIGRYPWLFGPAGSGKSTLAKQVADAMNLPFYSVSSLQQKYELEGYTDAVGNLVETTFYKAAKEGGIFLFDEASTTSAEVQVAWNSMLANLWYNFPKDGMIKAHKDFHVIAADNTTGRGGNSTYSARFQMDASTLDRYTCIRVDYTDEMDMRMAENDCELVDFIKDLRKAIELSRLTYTASPRALKAIKAHQKLFDEKEAFELGLCSGWNVQDIRTLAARLCGDNKYYKMFNEIAK